MAGQGDAESGEEGRNTGRQNGSLINGLSVNYVEKYRQPEWLNTLKARWLMLQWQRHIAPVVKPNPKQKPSAIPGFEHTLTLGLSTLDQLAALSGRGRKMGELIEDWLERLDTEKNSNYQALTDLVNQYWYGELPEKNLEELIELLSGVLQASAVRKAS